MSLGADAGALRSISDGVSSASGYASIRALKHIASVEHSVHGTVG